MNETVSNSTSVRFGKELSLDSPLLNLILAASLLSKISKTSSKAGQDRSGGGNGIGTGTGTGRPPLPYRYSDNYYNELPFFPRDAQHFYKLQASLDTHESSFPIRGHVIHVYPMTQDGGHSTKDRPSSYVNGTVNGTSGDRENSKIMSDQTDSPSSLLTKELKDFLTEFFTKNLPIIQDSKNSEPDKPPGVPEVSSLQELPLKNQVTSDKFVENISETLVDEMAQDLPQNATENEVKHMSEKVLQNLPSSILENIPPEMLEQISDKISEQISEKLSEKFSKDVSNHMLEKLAELIPERHNTSENLIVDSVIPVGMTSNEVPDGQGKDFPVYSEEQHLEDVENSEDQHTHVQGNDGLVKEMFGSQSAASSLDLHASETQKTERNRNSSKKPKSSESDDEYVFAGKEEDEDDDEDDEDTFREPERELESEIPYRVSPKFSQKLRSTTESPRKQIKNKASVQSPGRINSKRPTPSKRRTTPITLIYDDEAEEPTTKRRTLRKTTPKTTGYDLDEEKPLRQTQNLSKNKLKQAQISKRRTTSTTPAYPDYYNDPVDDEREEGYANEAEQDEVNQDYEETSTSKPRRTTRRPVLRQVNVTTTEATDTTGTETEEITTGTAPMNNTSTTQMPATSTTSGEYPYYGGNNYDNISITYGPPVHHNYGYGPSNGNEYVSFTYAPPSGGAPPPSSGGASGFSSFATGGGSDPGVAANVQNPTIDNWYNHYARASMYKRLQDLLTPNNFYSQYDSNYPPTA